MKIYNSLKEVNGSFLYNEENNTYFLKTNGYDCWDKSDRISMITTDRIDYLYDERSSITVEATVMDLNAVNNFSSYGITIRTDDLDSARNISLFTRRQGILVTTRKVDGGTTRWFGMKRWDDLSLPLDLRLCLTGSTVQAYYRMNGETEWTFLGRTIVDMGNSLMVGMLGYSHEYGKETNATFANFRCECKNDAPVQITGKAAAVEWEEDVLYREDFESGIVNTNKRAGYCWTNVTCPNIISTTGKDGSETLAWYKQNANGQHFVGDRKWYDYVLETDIKLVPDAEPENSTLLFFVRHKDMSFYGVFSYVIALKNGNTLEIRKIYASSPSLDNEGTLMETATYDYSKFTGQWMSVSITAFDNRISVSINGESVLSYTDESGFICPVGNIGFGFKSATFYIDNIIVRALEDELGGAYDNLVGGLWDSPAPEEFQY